MLAMFTSCAWFFDDLGRLEPRIALRHAARALDLLPGADCARLEAALLATLAHARSNDPAKGNGVAIWQRDVLPDANGPARLAAGLGALRDLSPDTLDDVHMPAHDWQVDGDEIIVRHRRTGLESRWVAEPCILGVLALRTKVRGGPGSSPAVFGITDYPEPIRRALREVATPLIYAAALGDDDAAMLQAGLLDPASARDRALAGAWRWIGRDGLDDAGVVLHGVLDLFELDNLKPSDHARAGAFLRLAGFPASPLRESIAARFDVAFGAT
jgi:hypothetical protein